MKESYGEGVATHTDPESCGAARKGGVEALTGARAGRVWSRESNFLRDADAVEESGRQHLERRNREALRGPARSETLSTYGNTLRGSREIPCPSAAEDAAGRVGKSKDVRRR
jgi:RNA-directed DNA polymerase